MPLTPADLTAARQIAERTDAIEAAVAVLGPDATVEEVREAIARTVAADLKLLGRPSYS